MVKFGSITNTQRFRLLEIQRAQRTLAENKARAQEYAQLAEDYASRATDCYNELTAKVTEGNRTQIEDKVKLAEKAKDDAVAAASSASSAALSGDVTNAEAYANVANNKLLTIQKCLQQVNFLLNKDNTFGITEEQWAILSGEELSEEDYDIVEQDENGIKSKVYTDKETGKLIKTEYYDESGNISKSVYYFELNNNKHLEITRNANEMITEAKEYTDEQNCKTTYYNTDGSVNYQVENSPGKEKTTYYTADGNTCVVQKTVTEGGNTETKVEFGNKTIVQTEDEISVNVGIDNITIKSANLTETYSFDGKLINEIYEFGHYTQTITYDGDDSTTTYTDKNGNNFTEAQWQYLSKNGISMSVVDNKSVYTKTIQNPEGAQNAGNAETSTSVPTKDITVKQEGDYIVITETDDNGTTTSTYIDVDGNVAKIVESQENGSGTITTEFSKENEILKATATYADAEGNTTQIITYSNYDTEPKEIESITTFAAQGGIKTETKKDSSGNILSITEIRNNQKFIYEYDQKKLTKETIKDINDVILEETIYNYEGANQTLKITYENGEKVQGTLTDNETGGVTNIDYKIEKQYENANNLIGQFDNGNIKTIDDVLLQLQELGLTEEAYTYTQENGKISLTITIGTKTIEYENNTLSNIREAYTNYTNNANVNSWEDFCNAIQEYKEVYDIYNYADGDVKYISFYFNGKYYRFEYIEVQHDFGQH